MTRWLIIFAALLLTACSSSTASPPAATEPPVVPTAPKADYPDLGAAPELTGDTWLNTDSPLRLADLRGKVVLIDMWTFG